MKFCPICKTRYDEAILRFCTKDGTPLVEEGEPNFTALPSENDLGEETVIRRKTPPPVPSTAQPVPDFDDEPERISAERIVIPTNDEEPPPMIAAREPVRTKTTASIRRQPPPQKSNTGLVVALSILGTIVVLAGAGGLFWAMSGQNSANTNQANYNVNLAPIDININAGSNVSNTLANFNYNLNANSNSNANANANANANLKSPTPTKTPTPTPTPNANANLNTNNLTNANTMTTPTPNVRRDPTPQMTATPTPRATPSREPPANRPVSAGVLNSRAVSLPKPAYPPMAKQMRAAGQVVVQVSVDESGNVLSAKAVNGNPLLRASAEAAARQSRFNPIRVNDQAVRATGVVLYNFVN